MPVVFWEDGCKFHFFSNEGQPREPIHVHVAKPGGGDAKLWLYPEVAFAYRHGFDARAQRRIMAIVCARRKEIEGAWNDHFAAGP